MRFEDTTPPDMWGGLFCELWNNVFEFGSASSFSKLQYTSKWFYNLFWDFQMHFDFGRDCDPSNIITALSKANSDCLVSISAPSRLLDDSHVALILICRNHFPRLKWLNLSGSLIGDRALSLVGTTFQGLKGLSIKNCDTITNKGLAGITGLTRLEHLTTEGCRQLTDQSLHSIGQLTRLTHLTMSPSNDALLRLDDGLGVSINVMELPRLRKLLGDGSVSNLRGLVHLQVLDLGPYMSITESAVASLSTLPCLKVLKIRQAQLMNTQSVHILSKMTQLTTLVVNKLQFAGKLYRLARLIHLDYLSVSSSTLTDEGLLALTSLRHLRGLDIMYCHRITSAGLYTFLSKVSSSIELIRFKGCNSLGIAAEETRPIKDAKGAIIMWENIGLDSS